MEGSRVDMSSSRGLHADRAGAMADACLRVENVVSGSTSALIVSIKMQAEEKIFKELLV